jgi:uncharacterized protein with von Willebrand factor type A (vWA) domain
MGLGCLNCCHEQPKEHCQGYFSHYRGAFTKGKGNPLQPMSKERKELAKKEKEKKRMLVRRQNEMSNYHAVSLMPGSFVLLQGNQIPLPDTIYVPNQKQNQIDPDLADFHSVNVAVNSF